MLYDVFLMYKTPLWINVLILCFLIWLVYIVLNALGFTYDDFFVKRDPLGGDWVPIGAVRLCRGTLHVGDKRTVSNAPCTFMEKTDVHLPGLSTRIESRPKFISKIINTTDNPFVGDSNGRKQSNEIVLAYCNILALFEMKLVESTRWEVGELLISKPRLKGFYHY